MKHIVTLLSLLLILPVTAVAITVDEVPNVHVASRSAYVSNPSGVLSSQAVNRLNSIISNLWDETSVEMAVVAVDSIDPGMTPEEFATALFEKWGIGKSDNDNGVLLLVSRNDRAAQIRTGYGVEGALPDIVAGRILRNDMFPLFRQGDYDGGTIAAVNAIRTRLTDPQVRDELKSKYENDRIRPGNDGDLNFSFFLDVAAVIALIMLAMVVYTIHSTRGYDDPQRWARLNKLWLPALIVSFLTLGLGFVPFGILAFKMHRVRRHKRLCHNCGTRMELVDEVHDNDYLSRSQDLEEKLNSVDYDVWHCPKCSQTDIYPFVNRSTPYVECPVCHARTMSLTERRVLRHATTRSEGEGVDIYYCCNCGNHTQKPFRIPRKNDDTAALAAGAILGSALGGRGGGGGSFGGGSFGGGHTGGGGAGGNW